MSDLTLTPLALRDGTWSGLLKGAADHDPHVRVLLHDTEIEGARVEQGEQAGEWMLRIPVPTEAIADGVHTFVVEALPDGAALGHFTLIAGAAAGEDLRAEVELLRAELDMLKRAFRRHCVETANHSDD